MEKGLNVFGAFDGHSCGQITLNELDIKIDKYFASEIDKHAIKVTNTIFPNTIQLGNIVIIRHVYCWKKSTLDLVYKSKYISDKTKEVYKKAEKQIRGKKIDLFIGGSPCQGFSFAGKQLNFSDTRSKLFFEFVKLLNKMREINPEIKFLLENVNMKKQYLRVISDYLGIFPARLNSNLVSAQNRDRWYWSNIKTKNVGLFSELHTDISQPKDRGILIKDILQPESEVESKYTLSSNAVKRLLNIDNKGFKSNIKNGNDKGACIFASQHKLARGMDIICVAMRGRNPENSNDRTPGSPTKQRLEPKTDGKTNCLTSAAKDNLIMQINQSKESGGNQPYQHNRIYDTNGQMPALTAELGGRNNIYNGYTLRRLTPRECGRLQTVPEHIIDIILNSGVSDTQIYKMFGNGWTIDAIKIFFSPLKSIKFI